MKFYRSPEFSDDNLDHSVSSSIFSSHKGTENESSIEVDMIDIMEFLGSIDSHVDILKMDIEGAEVPILEKMLCSEITNTTHIIVETHEHCLPELARRTHDIRKRVRDIKEPIIDLNWH